MSEKSISVKNTEIESHNVYIKNQNIFSLYFDGISTTNHGPGSYGGVIFIREIISPQRREFNCYYKYMTETTNEEAVYKGLLEGLKLAISLDIRNLQVFGDSELVIHQAQCLWKEENPKLNHVSEIKSLLKQFDNIDFTHILPKNNKRARELSNMILNKELTKNK